ncbi:MAG TPA: beta-L-arabinofuranosidase domain-containing protein, partial [Candidatus Bathyarchaeia archaeon]|nr:beta-L-arabinofuranosidase domain-containing protein [Candidatus Bathyarchaeia archaeon]
MMIMLTLAACVGAGDVLRGADIRQVEVGGEIGRRLDITVENNLLAINLEKDFLEPFLKREKSDGYIGLGKTIDAMARFCAYTEDARLIARKKAVVDALVASQEPDGYLGMFKKEARTTSLWDVHECSYLVLGLTSDYAFCGEQKSLEAARKLADYLIAELTATPPKKVGPDDLSPVMGTTGLDPAMLYLAEQTGESKYRDFVVNARKLPEWRYPMVLGRWGNVSGHAYAYMAECLAQVRLSEYVDDKGLWDETRNVFDFLLNRDGLVISGTCGDHECWHNTQSGTTNLGETCATAYLVRFCDEMLRKTGDSLFGDLIERAIYNALFAAQSPDGRRLRYYAPFEAPRQ